MCLGTVIETELPSECNLKGSTENAFWRAEDFESELATQQQSDRG